MISRWAYLIREGFRSITTHGFMSFASVTIIMACLVIMGIVSLLSVNIDALIKAFRQKLLYICSAIKRRLKLRCINLRYNLYKL